MIGTAIQKLRAAAGEGLNEDRLIDLVLRLTLIYHLGLFPSHVSHAVFPVFFLAAIGLIFRPALRHPLFWAALILVFGFHMTTQSVTASSRVLNFCWCIAIFISLLPGCDTKRVLVLNVRLLIGVIFAQAILWKVVIKQEFVDGSFMRYSLLFCEVFNDRVTHSGLISPEIQASNQQVWHAIINGEGAVQPQAFQEPAHLKILAWIMTIWTLLTEALLALAFLSPDRWKLARYRHPVLLAFMSTVFVFIPLWIFGGIFVAMGLIATSSREWRIRVCYILVYFLLMSVTWFMEPALAMFYIRSYLGS